MSSQERLEIIIFHTYTCIYGVGEIPSYALDSDFCDRREVLLWQDREGDSGKYPDRNQSRVHVIGLFLNIARNNAVLWTISMSCVCGQQSSMAILWSGSMLLKRSHLKLSG